MIEGHNHHWPNDIVYMRWMELGRVKRVARVGDGGCLAIYPTQNKDKFSLEAVGPDADSPGVSFNGLTRNEVNDEVWLRLLDGEEIRRILKDYQPTPLGEGMDGNNRFSYYLAKIGSGQSGIEYCRHNTFHIVSDMQERT